MISVYVASLIFGGILVLFSLFFGGEHNSDADSHIDFDSDASDISHEISEIHHDIDSESSVTDAVQFFSFRNLTYFITFFGLTGTIFSLLKYENILTLLLSIGIGTFAWVFSYRLIKYLKQSSSGETFNISDLKGKKGKVSLETGKNKKGKVIIDYLHSNYEIPAIISENANVEKLKFGEEILVIEINNGIAVIDKFDL